MSHNLVKNGDVLDSLQVYLREIKDESLLSAAEECELADAIARGDSDARSRLIQANLRLVVTIAREFRGRGLTLDDLIGEGNLGLIRAAQEFQPRFGTRFSTYAAYWIKQSIRHALINTTKPIRLPAHMVGLLTRWRRTERALARERGAAPSFDEVAAVLKLSAMQKMLVDKARQAARFSPENSVALDSDLHSPQQSWSRCESGETRLELAEERRAILRRMERLEVRECAVLEWRYGLEGADRLTLNEIGRRLGITREWVRKIELRAIRKLADASEGNPDHGSRARTQTRTRTGTRTRPDAAHPARRPRWPSRGTSGKTGPYSPF